MIWESFPLEIMDFTLMATCSWEDGCLARLTLAYPGIPGRDGWPVPSPRAVTLARRLSDILSGRTSRTDFPVRLSGTAFQERVWDAATRIPHGEVRSYLHIAQSIGCPSPRAVGQALKANPLPILIPCHRVTGKTGALTGFSQGIEIKRLLLAAEGHGLTS